MPPTFRAGAAEVDPHLATAADVPYGRQGHGATDDELPTLGEPDGFVSPSARSFRGRYSAQRGGPDVSGQLVSDGMDGALAELHAHPGAPDPRALWTGTPDGTQAGNSGTAPDALLPSPELPSNVVMAADAGNQQAPTQYRAGGTSADNTRTARHNLALFLRPFDKWASDVLAPILGGSNGKQAQPSPLAALPPVVGTATPNAAPNAGGTGPVGGFTAAGPNPNTMRLIPRPWDELLYQTAGDTGSHATVARAKGWRAS